VKRIAITALVAVGLTASIATFASAQGSGPQDQVYGSGIGTPGGTGVITFAADSEPNGASPGGHVIRLKPNNHYRRGRVVCLNVSGNVAALVYQVRRADPQHSDLEGKYQKIFVRDNGPGTGDEWRALGLRSTRPACTLTLPPPNGWKGFTGDITVVDENGSSPPPGGGGGST